jgi:tubulin delta
MLINAVVWPFSVGEVILQNYNALLTLSTLSEVRCVYLFSFYVNFFLVPNNVRLLICIFLKRAYDNHQVSDAVVVMENDALHRLCRQRLQLASPTFEDINAVLARTLASVLLPSARSSPNLVHVLSVSVSQI